MKKKPTSPDAKRTEGPRQQQIRSVKKQVSKATPYFVQTNTPKQKTAGA